MTTLGKNQFDPPSSLAQATSTAKHAPATTPTADEQGTALSHSSASAFNGPLPTTSAVNPAVASTTSATISDFDDAPQSFKAPELSADAGQVNFDAPGLVERNYAIVYRYAYRLTGCAATAEDITQESFLQAIAHLAQLRSRDTERGWLLAITRRQFMRWLRQVASPTHGRPVSLQSDDALAQEVVTQENDCERLDNRDWIQSAIAEIGYDARVALLMYYFEDLSYMDIANQLQIPIGTVMSRLSRGRQQLKGALGRTNSVQLPSGQQPSGKSPSTAPPTAHNLPLSAQEVKHG